VLPSNLINKLDHVASLDYTVNLRLDHAEEEIRRLRDDVHVVQRDIANWVARMAALEEASTRLAPKCAQNSRKSWQKCRLPSLRRKPRNLRCRRKPLPESSHNEHPE
jgi:uncharacterized membrane protein